MVQALEHKQTDRSLTLSVDKVDTLSVDKVDTLSMEVLKAEAIIKTTHDSIYSGNELDEEIIGTMFFMLEESFGKIKGMIKPLLK